MLQTNQLIRTLTEGKIVFGLLNSIPSPLMVEMIGYAGFDFVILDMEHVCVNPETRATDYLPLPKQMMGNKS